MQSGIRASATKRLSLAMALAATGLSAWLAPAATASAAERPRFVSTACFTSLPDGVRRGRDIRCGTVAVPLDHSRPDGAKIRLAVAVLLADARRPEPDPVMVLAGGPGEKIVGLAGVIDGPEALTGARDRDVVLLDQRGVGFSRPALECPEVFEALGAGDVSGAFGACRDRLAADTDLSQYNTAANAADLALVRRALGYREVNLYGGSYGSYLALAAMRGNPEWIRSVILSSPVAPMENYVEDVGSSYRRSLKAVSAACAADPVCDRAYPRLGTALARVLGRLSVAPVPLAVTDPATGERVTVPLTDVDVTSVVFQLLYVAEAIRVLPALITALDEGDYSLFKSEEAFPVPTESPISLGMQLSVQCAEVVPRTSAERILARAEDIGRAARTLVLSNPIVGLPVVDICARWDVEERLAVTRTVRSNLPTLLVTGEFDPITPPSYGRRAARTLRNSVLIEARGVGHSPLLSLGSCGERILQRFLDSPGRRPASRCARRPIDFLDVTARTAARTGIPAPPLFSTAPQTEWPPAPLR